MKEATLHTYSSKRQEDVHIVLIQGQEGKERSRESKRGGEAGASRFQRKKMLTILFLHFNQSVLSLVNVALKQIHQSLMWRSSRYICKIGTSYKCVGISAFHIQECLLVRGNKLEYTLHISVSILSIYFVHVKITFLNILQQSN